MLAGDQSLGRQHIKADAKIPNLVEGAQLIWVTSFTMFGAINIIRRSPRAHPQSINAKTHFENSGFLISLEIDLQTKITRDASTVWLMS